MAFPFRPFTMIALGAMLLPFQTGAAQSAGFVVRLGHDTLAVERITRTADRIEGELLRRIPSTHLVRYVATLDPEGYPRELTFTLTRPGPGARPMTLRGGRVVFGRDSARIELQGDSLTVRTLPAPMAFPALPESYGLYELWLSTFRRAGRDSAFIPTVAPLGGPSGRMLVYARGADSVFVPYFGTPASLRVSGTGDLLGLDGRATVVKNEVERIAPVDLMPIAERFAAVEAAAGAMGTWISPRDTVTATVGNASLWVDYGRPAARGRDVFANGVLGDTLWRTGANAATQFRTDRDLLIGSARVPAGTYTLWTHYDAGRATLVINTQTGQWGTQYNRARDLVRVPLQVRQVDGPPVELFTIMVRPDQDGGVLSLRWDRTELSVGFEVVGSGPEANGGNQDPPIRQESGFVTTSDGVRLAYSRVGTGGDILVVPMRAYLAEFLAPLARGRQVIFYDPRGRGASDSAGTSAVSLDRQVADLEALRAALGIERMALLGWSGLGMEMAVYTLRHPERVTRLVQVSPVPPARVIMQQAGGDTRSVRTDTAAVRVLLARFDAGDFRDDPAGFCARYQQLTLPANFADTSLARRAPDICGYANEWPVNLWRYFGRLLPSFGDYDWRDALRGLEVPRLVVHGREDGIPLAGARAWVAGYPSARLLELSPAGHFPFIERPAEFFAAVLAFLDGGWPAGAVALPAV